MQRTACLYVERILHSALLKACQECLVPRGSASPVLVSAGWWCIRPRTILTPEHNERRHCAQQRSLARYLDKLSAGAFYLALHQCNVRAARAARLFRPSRREDDLWRQ